MKQQKNMRSALIKICLPKSVVWSQRCPHNWPLVWFLIRRQGLLQSGIPGGALFQVTGLEAPPGKG